MKTTTGYQDHSIAYALAAGLVVLDDQGGEKERRRARYTRKQAYRGNSK